MQTAGYILECMLLRPYLGEINFYRKRILPMQTAGYMRERMLLCPYWVMNNFC